MKYRIIATPAYDGTPRYTAQRKCLFFWVQVGYNERMKQEFAQEYIDEDIKICSFKKTVVKEIES